MKDDTQSVPVRIFGEEYVIRTDKGEDHTRRCARYVDEAIEDAHLRGHVSEEKAAILAAMEITDELFELREERRRETRRVGERLRRLRGRLDEALETASPDEGAGSD